MTRFVVGQAVRVADAHPPGHVRTPSFVRGRSGVVLRHFGAFPNPERLAYGMNGLPALELYQVRFAMEEIWAMAEIWPGEGIHGPRDSVTADIYEPWLEAI